MDNCYLNTLKKPLLYLKNNKHLHHVLLCLHTPKF